MFWFENQNLKAKNQKEGGAGCGGRPFSPAIAGYGPSRPGRVFPGAAAARGCDRRAECQALLDGLVNIG